MMKIYYSLSAQFVINENDIDSKLNLLKQAGVTNINLLGYFWGHFESPLEQIIQARDILINKGFDVGIISVGVGHPGNALDPSNPNLSLQIPSHWRYRHNLKGAPVHFCADFEENMLKDNKDAVQLFLQNNFQEIFFDDDCRLGNWGSEIQGCFCPHCIRDFNQNYHRDESLISLAKVIQKRKDHKLMYDWVEFNCRKLIHFFEAIYDPRGKMGLMVMHRGDERHGIDIKTLQQHVPNMLFRIGEEHFSDRHFEAPKDKVSELTGMMAHLNLIDSSIAFSETTVFPQEQLSPDNLLYKAKMALALGIPNIYLMNGLGFLDEKYWNCFIQHFSELDALANACLNESPTYPIHLLDGTHGAIGETIQNSPYPFLAGLPIKPVRAGEVGEGADILFVIGKYEITPEWQTKLNKYQFIIFDVESYRLNKSKIQSIPKLPFQILSVSVLDLIKLKSKREELIIRDIRMMISGRNPSYPYLTRGKKIGMIWRKNQNNLILLNLERIPNECEIMFNGKKKSITLNPLEIRIKEL